MAVRRPLSQEMGDLLERVVQARVPDLVPLLDRMTHDPLTAEERYRLRLALTKERSATGLRPEANRAPAGERAA